MCLAGAHIRHDFGHRDLDFLAAVLSSAAVQAQDKGIVGCFRSLDDLELDAAAPKDVPAVAPGHGARVFLQERRTRGYLTIAQAEAGHEQVVMTRSAASLFECHRSDVGLARPTVHSCAALQLGMLDVSRVAEETSLTSSRRRARGSSPQAAAAPRSSASRTRRGLPGFGAFLSAGSATWWQGWLRPGGVDAKMQCRAASLGLQERFRWMDDGTIQHVPSGKWLYVDPTSPDEAARREGAAGRR
ncbi:unnamed protein product [Prorocentrum cordatum]|uniref:Uncharacterized protein n=1 Tax=Prorocentrum cordatum TaxID=2364126 RepID=A0ABN9SHF3_9DINO|nr:unnamed protein product [Polarella glacialis]